MRLPLLLTGTLLLLCTGAHVRADVIYQFSGICTSGPFACDFTANGPDELHLVDGFVPGSLIGPSDVIGFFIDGISTLDPLVGPAPGHGSNICGFPDSAACSGQNLGLVFSSNAGFFTSNADGTWAMTLLASHPSYSGTDATWTLVSPALVPLPASAWLIASALAGLGALRSQSKGCRKTMV